MARIFYGALTGGEACWPENVDKDGGFSSSSSSPLELFPGNFRPQQGLPVAFRDWNDSRRGGLHVGYHEPFVDHLGWPENSPGNLQKQRILTFFFAGGFGCGFFRWELVDGGLGWRRILFFAPFSPPGRLPALAGFRGGFAPRRGFFLLRL